MPRVLLPFLTLLTLTAAAQEVQRIDHFKVGTRISYFMGACDQEPPLAAGRLSYCDEAGNLGVVMESLGLNDRGVLRLAPNYFNDSEVFLTRQGISIRHGNGSWENIPNEAIPVTDSRFTITNAGTIEYGLVDKNGLIYFTVRTTSRRLLYTYDLATKEVNQIPVSDRQGVTHIAYNAQDDHVYLLMSGVQNIQLVSLVNEQAIPIRSLTEFVGRSTSVNTTKFTYHRDSLWVSTNQGLLAVDATDTDRAQLFDADSGRLPVDAVTDFAFAADGTLWLTQTQGNRGAIVRYDATADSFEEYVLINPGSSNNVEVKFQDLDFLNDGRVTAVASSLFGIIDLDWRGNEPVWTFVDRDSLAALGLPITYTPTEVSRYENRVYYLTDDFSTGNSTNFEVLIREGDTWTGRNDDRPGNYSYWELERFEHFERDDRGGMYFYSSADKNISYMSPTEGLRGRQFASLPPVRPAVDAEGRLVYNDPIQRGWQLLDWPVTASVNDVPTTNTLVATHGNTTAFFSRNSGEFIRTINGRIVARDTLPDPSTYGSYFGFGIDDDGSAWVAADRRSPTGTIIKKYDMTTQEVTTYDREEEIGQIRRVHPGPGGKMYVIGERGVILIDPAANAGQVHSLLGTEDARLQTIYGGVVDAADRLWILTDFVGTYHIIEDLAATPTINTFKIEDLLPFTRLYGSTTMEIDAEGDLWIEGVNSVWKVVDTYTEPSYRTEGDSYTLAGRVYLDANDNGTYDETEGLANQSVVVTVGELTRNVLTSADGSYAVLLERGDAEYTITLPVVDRLMLADDRQLVQQVGRTDLNYGGLDFRLTYKNYHSLYFQTANKAGAWGFEREGFENTFTTAVTNLSLDKPFRELAIELLYFNEEPGSSEFPEVKEVKITRLSPTTGLLLSNYLTISPKNHRWSVRGLPASAYTTSDIELNEEIRTADDTTAVTVGVGELAARETVVVEVIFDLFPGQSNGTVIVYTPGRVDSPDVDPDGEGARPPGTVFIYPDEGTTASPFDDPNSPYLSPDEIYSDPPYLDPEDVYAPSPYKTPIRSSYDPNDKSVDGGLARLLNENELDEKWLSYTIRFENEGNFSAKDVWVLDTLDERVQTGSFTLLDASHDVRADFSLSDDSTNIVRFSFEDIYLPFQDSINDGYVRFALRVAEDVTVGDTVSNQAAIYFDQNPPIITNRVRNRFVEISVPVFNPRRPEIELEVFPNPASDWVTLRSPHEMQAVRLLDMQGRLVADYGRSTRLPLDRIPDGVYLLVVQTDAGRGTRRVVVR
jgi:hypothetical protein